MVEEGKNIAKRRKETPLQMQNTQVILRKLESDMAKILAEYTLNPNTPVDEAKENLKELVSGIMPKIHKNFDINLFDLAIVPVPNNPSTLSIQPQNFITALWLHGISVTAVEMEGVNNFTTNIATYDWDEEKKLLGIMPKPMPDFDMNNPINLT